MNRWYDKYLVRKYAPLYRNRYGDMKSTAMCWGFECGDGWFNIINNLSYQFCAEWIHAKKEYDRIVGRIGERKYLTEDLGDWNPIITDEMIAMRYGTMIREESKIPVAIQVKEKFGGLRFYIDGGDDIHYALINFAESLSYYTCEVCGKPGKASRGGWITTRCDDHRDD
jgi:hypothetical protein